MKPSVVLMLSALAGPVAAESSVSPDVCSAIWTAMSEQFIATGAYQVVGTTTEPGPSRCDITNVVVDVERNYAPDWHIDKLTFTSNALPWINEMLRTGTATTTPPETLEIGLEGVRIVAETGNPTMDWLIAAESRPNKINANLALAWDAQKRLLRLEALTIDFPGDNLVEFSAAVTGVDLSSTGAMQMSATSFALTEADLRITTHGLFEAYILVPLGGIYLAPMEGDIDAAVAGMKAELVQAVGALPASSFSSESKAALAVLIGELPNPAGDLRIAVRSEAGIGPTRFGGYAVTGAPETLAEAARLLEGVTVDATWTHGDAP
jgi:hypothetical protein